MRHWRSLREVMPSLVHVTVAPGAAIPVDLHGPAFHPQQGKEAGWPGEAKIAGRAVLAGLIGEGPAGDLFLADISQVVATRLNPGATVLVIESWTLGALSQTAPGSAVARPLTAAPEVDGWAITERPLKDLTRLGDRVWLVADDVHELGPADAGRHLELLVMRGPLEASSCSAQELTAPDTEQSSHGPRVP
jgi:hypothetical protein